MDGTLTVPMHDFVEIRRRLGIPQDRDILQYIKEQPIGVRENLERRLEDWEYEIACKAQASSDALALLEKLKERRYKCAVLTRNTRAFALVTLKSAGILDYFDEEVVLGRDSANPKPSPDGINQILSHWNANVDDAVMIGDDINDVLAANNAGCTSVFIERNRPLAEPGSADILCRDLKAFIF